VRRTMADVFAGTALLLAGCNGGGSSNPSPCAPPNGIRTVLVYPAPGSTGIPANLRAIVLGSTAALPSGFQAVLANNTTGNSVGFNVAVPGFASPIYQSSGNPGVVFFAGSTIIVYLNNLNSGCVPATSLGSFRVQ
jgi:hypothetical protein